MTKKQQQMVLPTQNLRALVLGDKPYSHEWAVDGARQRLNTHLMSGIELGMYVLLIKEEEGHGGYETALREIGLDPSTAWRYARRAEFILANPNLSDCKIWAGSKLDELRKLPTVTLAEVIDEEGHIAGYSLDEVQAMTTAQFAEALGRAQQGLLAAHGDIQDMEKALHNRETHIETLEMKNEQLEARLRDRTRPGPYPEYVAEIRLESSALADKALQCIDDLERLYAKLENPELDASDKHARSNFGVAASTYYHNLRAIAAKAGRLLVLCHEQLGEELNDSLEGLPLLTADEAKHVLSLRSMMLAEHSAEKIGRENRLKDDYKKPGRRKGAAS